MGWSNIPLDLLITIKGKLITLTDQIAFRLVCSHWRSAVRSLLPLLPPQLPRLLVPSGSHVCSLSKDRIYPLPISSNIARSTYIFGSASGWLLVVKWLTPTMNFSIMDPLTGASVTLPCQDSSAPLFQAGANALVWDRSHSSIVAACSNRMSVYYCHLGSNQSWELIGSTQNIQARSITYYKSKFYIHNVRTSEIVVLGGETPNVMVVININHLCIWSWRGTVHLVGCSGESLLFLLYFSVYPSIDDYKIYVCEMDLKDKNCRKVDDIGNRALFLDFRRCFLVDVDKRSKLKRNCLYVAHPQRKSSSMYMHIGHMSVFNLRNLEHVRLADLSAFHGDEFGPPTWILPSFN